MKKYFKSNINLVQMALTVMVWLLLFAIPLFFGDNTDHINWDHILKIWKEYLLLFLVFLINRFFLMPQIFFKGQRILYFVSITAFIVLISGFAYYLEPGMQPGPQGNLPLEHSGPPPQFPDRPIGPGPGHKPVAPIPPFANLLVISILLIGFDSGLLFFSKWVSSEQKKLKAEKESIANKMAFLQNQVSPHFFMNTLNNIHALVDIDAEEAKEAIIRLSKMMSYMLYESNTHGVSLQQEMEFIRSYIDLMKLRLNEQIDLKLDIPTILPKQKIPPLLTISFIENAFKYGISYQNPSFVHIRFQFHDNTFHFRIKNSYHGPAKKTDKSGIGIQNTKKRLDILFGENYRLDIQQHNDSFEVNLNFPL